MAAVPPPAVRAAAHARSLIRAGGGFLFAKDQQEAADTITPDWVAYMHKWNTGADEHIAALAVTARCIYRRCRYHFVTRIHEQKNSKVSNR